MKIADRLLEILADLIARLIIVGGVILIFFRIFLFDVMVRDNTTWRVGLAAGIAIGLLVSIVVIRKRPEDP